MVEIKLDRLDAVTKHSVLKCWICPVVSVTVTRYGSVIFQVPEYLCCNFFSFFYEDIFQSGLSVIDFHDCNYFFEICHKLYW